MQYMEVMAPLYPGEKNLGCICSGWFTCDEIDHIACGKEPKIDFVKVGEWYGAEVYH